MFRGDLLRNPDAGKMKNGMTIQCQAQVSVYAKRGTFQLIVRSVVVEGKGNLQEQFEKLKLKLSGEGLFDASRKRLLPQFAKRVAIITAETGAALQDFLEVYSRRSIFMDIVIVPTLVQGEKSPEAILKSLKLILSKHKHTPFDVVVLARGGGSLEDLWAFNDETLCRYLASYEIVTISAIGHQTDFCLTDFVADVRAETPTAAAQILTESQAKLLDRLNTCLKGLQYWHRVHFNSYVTKLNSLRPRYFIELLQSKINFYRRRIDSLYSLRQIERITNFHEKRLRIDECRTQLNYIQTQLINNNQLKLQNLYASMTALNPQHVLSRGFCYMTYSDRIISSKDIFMQMPKNTPLSLTFVDGKVQVWNKD